MVRTLIVNHFMETRSGSFIRIMEKALIGSLVSLWLLAGWVLLKGMGSLFFWNP
ncbi:MAG: hypothetical protein HQL94_07560 [Magnetococcales bacterium]|nr:hypothetical protein [Magnetococcales bacterium]